MVDSKMIFVLNSDFGKRNTIGARSSYIFKSCPDKDAIVVFARGFLKKNPQFKQVVPAGRFIMRALTAIPIFFRKFKTNKIKDKIFEYFLLKKIKKINLNEVKIIHSWDFLPDFYKFIKINYPDIKIIQDVPMAINIVGIKDQDKLFPGENLNTPEYVKDCFSYIDNFICSSNFVFDSLVREGIDKEKITIIPFGVDIDEFMPNLSQEKNMFKVCFSGSVNNRKGISYLIQAWKELNLRDAELNLYGRVYPEVGQYLKDKEKYNIRTFGFMNLKEELCKNSLYVLPSLFEGSAKSIYEALACGLPVITTYNSGSVVENEKDGFIVPIQDVQAIKEKILFFYNNRGILKQFSLSARKKAELFTWEKYGNKINEIYIKL